MSIHFVIQLTRGDLMRYTAKHLCKFFNINRETLRHYEKVGLVTPYIDPNSRLDFCQERGHFFIEFLF